jgi:hypothetical protein
MAISQPLSTDLLNSPDHSLMHRIIASDPAAPAQSLTVDSTGAMSSAANADVVAAIGRAKVGNGFAYIPAADWATFSHYDHALLNNYAIAQGSSGQTIVNAASGQTVCLSIANSQVAVVDVTGLYIITAGNNGLQTNETKVLQAMNLVNHAKFLTLEHLNQIIGTSYIRGLWVLDQTGAVTSVTDRSPLGHTMTLSVNASSMVPGVAGLCPFLLSNNGTNYWYVADHSDFSFGNGSVDTPFSLIALANPQQTSDNSLITKYGGEGADEWELRFYTDTLYAILRSQGHEATYICQASNSGLSGDIGGWHVYILTYSGSSLYSGIKLYRDGVLIASTGSMNGTYVAMSNGTANVCPYNAAQNGWGNNKDALRGIVARELFAADVKRISDLLLAYAGTFV